MLIVIFITADRSSLASTVSDREIEASPSSSGPSTSWSSQASPSSSTRRARAMSAMAKEGSRSEASERWPGAFR